MAATERKPRKKRKPKYPPELWTNIETLYRSGQFNGVDSLLVYCKKTFPDVPTKSAVQKHFIRDGIKRGDNKVSGALKAEIEKRSIDMFADLGMPKEEVMRLIIEGMTCARGYKEKLLSEIKAAIASGVSPITEATVHAVDSLFNRMSMAHPWIRTYMDWTGVAAPKKVDLSNKGEPFAGPSFTNMTDEELERKLKERLERLTRTKKAAANGTAEL